MRLRELAVAIGVLSLACWQAAVANELEPLPRTTRPLEYKITVTPDAVTSKYTGRETIRFEVLEPTRDVVVHSVGLEIESVRVDGEPATIRFDADRGRAIFRAGQNLDRGIHELQLSFSGSISEHGDSGLFTRGYVTPDGVAKKPLFTMLCCLSAGRRFMPLWDQPDMKAVFELELIVPQDLLAVSNMPVASREAVGDGRAHLRFLPTPKMSSYLLFFALGEFERVHANVGVTEVGIIVRRGMAPRARTALDATTGLLGFYNDYFATPFPLPKLDSVGLTGAAGFGGMENWGSILYSERFLLADPQESSETELRDSHALIAHEIAHQWFGDLVTARAWDDLWLDEGFANWMEHKATEHFHPQWQIWMRDGAETREAAMRFDARESSYAIVPNHSFEKEITYTKSGQVIRMLEAYVGEEKFREAMRSYLRKHAYGSTKTADMWAALDEVSDSPVSAIGRDFTGQKGVPLIDVVTSECVPGSEVTHVVLRQDRFALDSRSKKRQSWRVPVTASVVGDERVARQIVTGGKSIRLDVPGCGPVKVNAGETGYFRTRYDPASFSSLERSFSAMSPADQLGLLNDSFSLAEGGYGSFDRYLDLAARVDVHSDPMVLFQLVSAARSLDRYFNRLPNQARFRAYARSRFGAMLTKFGWTKQADEAPNRGILRAQLIELLGQLQEPDVLTEALRRFRGAPLDASLLPADIRESVLRTVGAGTDAATLREFLARAAASADPSERNRLLLSAAGASDPAIATQLLQLMTGESFPADLIPDVAQAIAEKHPELTFDFVTSHLDALAPRLEEGAHKWLVPSLLMSADDPALTRKLNAFAAKNLDPQERRRSVPAVHSAITFRDLVRKQRLARVDAWLSRLPSTLSASAGPLVLLNGTVYTANPSIPRAEAVVAVAGRITFVGTKADALKHAPKDARQIDLRGLTVFPGLTDSHAHLGGYGAPELTFDVEGASSLADLQRRLREQLVKGQPGGWLVGSGWIESRWTPAVFPTNADLDAVVSDRPVLLWRSDGHGAVANSRALALAGVDRNTPDPFGGKILKDAATGEPNGMLVDNAVEIVSKLVPQPTDEQQIAALEAVTARHVRMGWTQLQLAGNDFGEVDQLCKLYSQGRIKLRLYDAIYGPGADADRLLAQGPQLDRCGDRFTLRGIKLFIDGALGSRGAALLAPYDDAPESSGLLVAEPNDLLPLLTTALKRGVQIETHAIGDRGNRVMLDLYEKAFASVPVKDRAVPEPRWRIEHAQHLTAVDIPRFKQLGVIASMQPSGAIGDLYFAPSRLGPERLAYGYAWRSLLDAGAIVVAGSDVEKSDPIVEFYAAVTRRSLDGFADANWHLEQRVTREEALQMLSIWPAYAAFQEKERGSIEVGKQADFTVFSADLMTVPDAKILDTKVVMTIIAGEVLR